MGAQKNVFLRFLGWMNHRLRKMGEYDTRRGRWFLIVCWVASSIVAVLLALGYPTGAGWMAHSKDIAIFFLLQTVLFALVTVFLAGLFSMMYLPFPRLNVASYVYLATLSVVSLITNKNNLFFLLIGGIGYSLAAVATGFLLVMIIRKNKAAISVALLLVLALAGVGVYSFATDNSSQTAHPVAALHSKEQSISNPGQPGEMDYTFFTYGSGKDIQRSAFGKDVKEVTSSVDASSIVDKWSEKRTDFWGFDQTALPVNGRVFLPEGEGPFPLILLVHGNHTMEYFSTDGYDYLGEQLASRGFVTISVDEDFINYSNISGIPNDDYTLRAWMLLQHLVELTERNQSPESELYHKIDFDNVALTGHSRGGQAVIMAADYQNFFPDEHLHEAMDSIQIKAVAALAPTDKKIDETTPKLHNISYMTLQGARDADIAQFRGDYPFYRTTFDADHDGFKASVYIEKANHTQFNQSWGYRDLSLPKGLFLNQRDTMTATDQRRLTEVYLSAFFESVLHGKTGYRDLFKNPHYGQNWLPETKLITKYRDAAYRPIVTFDEEDISIVEANEFSDVKITTPTDRGGKKHLQDSLYLEWKKEAKLPFSVTKKDLRLTDQSFADEFVLTMANIKADEKEARVPAVNVEIQTTDGVSVEIPLEEFMPFSPVIATDYTPFGLLDKYYEDGKYEEDWEPTFQTFSLSFDVFENKDSDFQREHISQLMLHFSSYPGKILVEELGVQ